MFNLRPFSEKMKNYKIYIFVKNSKNIEFITSLMYKIESLMIWQTMYHLWFDINANSKSKLLIFGADHQLFGKQSKKSGEIIYWKEGGLSEYVPKIIKHLFSNALFIRLIEKWLFIKRKKELNNFGLKIRIFEISKIKIVKKNVLQETVHVTPRYSVELF